MVVTRLDVLEVIARRGAGFRSLADAWADTTMAHGWLMPTILGGLAAFERALIRARTEEGLLPDLDEPDSSRSGPRDRGAAAFRRTSWGLTHETWCKAGAGRWRALRPDAEAHPPSATAGSGAAGGRREPCQDLPELRRQPQHDLTAEAGPGEIEVWVCPLR